jgi:hypothetical protein
MPAGGQIRTITLLVLAMTGVSACHFLSPPDPTTFVVSFENRSAAPVIVGFDGGGLRQSDLVPIDRLMFVVPPDGSIVAGPLVQRGSAPDATTPLPAGVHVYSAECDHLADFVVGPGEQLGILIDETGAATRQALGAVSAIEIAASTKMCGPYVATITNDLSISVRIDRTTQGVTTTLADSLDAGESLVIDEPFGSDGCISGSLRAAPLDGSPSIDSRTSLCGRTRWTIARP